MATLKEVRLKEQVLAYDAGNGLLKPFEVGLEGGNLVISGVVVHGGNVQRVGLGVALNDGPLLFELRGSCFMLLGPGVYVDADATITCGSFALD